MYSLEPKYNLMNKKWVNIIYLQFISFFLKFP